MGRVFLGVSPGGRQVAVKVIHAGLADSPDCRARFAREVAALRKVRGIYTAPVVDACAAGPVPWLATAHVDALPSPMPWKTAGRCPPVKCSAGREPCRGPAGDPPGRGHSPRPEAVERGPGRRRAAGHRLRHLARCRGERPDQVGPDRGIAGVHVEAIRAVARPLPNRRAVAAGSVRQPRREIR